MALQAKTVGAVKANNKKLIILCSWIALLLCFYVLAVANINGGYLTPFAFGLYFALLWCNYNMWYTSGIFLIANSLAGFSLNALFSSLNYVAVGILAMLLHKAIKKSPRKILMCLYALLGSVAFAVLNATGVSAIIASVIAILLGVLFCFACMHFLGSTVARKFNYKLNTDEIICGSVMLMVFCMGLTSLNPFGIEFLKIFAVYVVLVCVHQFRELSGLLVAAVMGLGAAAATGNAGYIAVFVFYAVFARAFKTKYKLPAMISIILTEVLFGLYFVVYEQFTVFSVVSVILPEILFLITPQKWFTLLNDVLGGHKDKVAVRSIVNRSREGICKRMNEIATVFKEMDTVFRGMVQGVLPAAEAKKMIANDLIEKCCSSCPERNKCLRVDGKATHEVLNDLVKAGFERGKVTLLDVPQYLTTRCGRLNYLLSTANGLLSSFIHYKTMITNMDSSRILIADQLNGVSSILKNLGEEVKLNISFNPSLENRVIEELSYKNIYCLEAVIYEYNTSVKNAALIIKTDDYNKEVLEKVVGKAIGCKMKVASAEPSQISGATAVTLKTKANFDIVFGSTAISKMGEVKNGDAHSLIKIDDGKYMVALCDGMGSGERANKTSNLAISLIENFYKAGFDNEIILNSVNKLLALNNEENFSALDLCVLDLNKNTGDFIKLGSPYGFIKRKISTEIIESSGLPIGVLDEMQPHIEKKVVDGQDVIILVSDGVTESFSGADALANFINNINSVNPQTITEEIADAVLNKHNGTCPDDVTAVAVRIFPI